MIGVILFKLTGFYDYVFGSGDIYYALKRIIIVIILYLLMYSNTLLGLLMKLAACYVIYVSYDMYAQQGNPAEGIRWGALVALVLFWPLIVKYIFKIVKYILDRYNLRGY